MCDDNFGHLRSVNPVRVIIYVCRKKKFGEPKKSRQSTDYASNVNRPTNTRQNVDVDHHCI